MILLINTSSGLCQITLADGVKLINDNWQADKDLARHLLRHLHETINKNGFDWPDISSIGIFTGPGSFTGLRIGITAMNTLADGLNIPIVGSIGDNWQKDALSRLENGENDKIVLPNYGSDAKITTPKK